MKTDHFSQASLQKAFNGKHAPQDPNEEPESILLEKIIGEKEISIKK